MTAEEQIRFLTNLQRLLSEGSFVATYKYALLLALADISVESGHDDDRPLQISTRHIAEKFIEYYWRQTAPYSAGGSGDGTWILRQWAIEVGDRSADLSNEFDRCGIRHDWPTSVRIVDWVYRQTYQSGGLTWVRGDDLQPLPADWQAMLLNLIH